MNVRISAIVITHNEERDLPDCLESLRGWVDEVIVVDSHSTDATRKIAQQFGAKVFERDWPGYGAQKQFALEHATGDWVLNLDADERVSPSLRSELQQFAHHPNLSFAGYEIPFHVYFLNRRLRFGGCFSEKHVRFFQRNKSQYVTNVVHEDIRVMGSVGKLSGSILHHSYHNFEEYLNKTNQYTGLIAERTYARGKRFHLWHHLRLPGEFFLRYVLKGGFLDGNMGFVYATLSSYYAWLKKVRLMDREMQ